jgi:undecaprenyl diphosphate synthase
MTETCSQWQLQPANLPRHVGIIMDGNGRWATARSLPRIMGHREGVKRVQEITELAGNLGIGALTLYAFSDENWRRPEDEVGALMGLLRWYLRAERARIVRNNVRFRVIGDRRKLSSDILELITDLEAETRSNTGMHLAVALSYGGRGEILRAVKRLVGRVDEGSAFVDDLDESAFEACLDTAGLPPLDMVVRTSGEQRVSNFLLWQAAYAEFFFDCTLWPDFDSSRFVHTLRGYASRERRFGQTPEQAVGPSSPSSASGPSTRSGARAAF